MALALLNNLKTQFLLNKKLITGSFWITAGNIIKVFLGIIILPFYARYVTPSILGSFDFAMSLMPFVNQAISLGLTNSISRFYLQTKNAAYLGFVQKRIIRNTLIVLLVLFAAYLVFYETANEHLPFLAFLILLITTFITNISFVPNLYFTIDENYKRASLVDLISTILRYGGTILLLILLPDKMIALFLGTMLGGGFILLQSHVTNYKIVYNSTKLNPDERKAIFRYANPLIFLGLAGVVYSSFDRVLLGSITGSSIEVGYYGMGQRLSGIISMGIIGIITVWGINAFKTLDDQKFLKMQHQLIWLLLSILASSIVFLLVFQHFIVSLVFTDTYAVSFGISLWVIIYFIWNKIRETIEYYFNRKGNSRLVTIVFISMTALNCGLFFVFIPIYKALGAAIAMTVSAVIHSSVLYCFSARQGHKLKKSIVYSALGITALLIAIIILFF